MSEIGDQQKFSAHTYPRPPEAEAGLRRRYQICCPLLSCHANRWKRGGGVAGVPVCAPAPRAIAFCRCLQPPRFRPGTLNWRFARSDLWLNHARAALQTVEVLLACRNFQPLLTEEMPAAGPAPLRRPLSARAGSLTMRMLQRLPPAPPLHPALLHCSVPCLAFSLVHSCCAESPKSPGAACQYPAIKKILFALKTYFLPR